MGRALTLASTLLTIGCAAQPTAPSAAPPFLAKAPVTELDWSTFGPFDDATAAAFVTDRVEALGRLLAVNKDPYTGRVLTDPKCRRENLPPPARRKTAREASVALSLYSSDDKVLGHCDRPDHVRKTQYLLLTCGPRVHVIRYFYPAAEAWREEPVAGCKP